MKLNSFLLCLAMLVACEANAQIPYINSRELLEQGVKFHENKEYKKAIEYYKMIPDGDTNYVQAVYEQAMSLTSDSALQAGIDMAHYGLSLPRNPIKRDFLLLIANAYDYLGQEDLALRMYDSLTLLYPLDNQPFYERGVLYFRRNDYDLAAYNFQRSLIYNPFHFNSSYLLGTIYTLQGRLSEAMIVLEGSLLTDNKEMAQRSINLLAEISRMSDEVSKAYKSRDRRYKHPLFSEIDEIIAAKLSFNKDYQVKTELDDKITRQTQVILEKLTYSPGDTNFVMQYYVPLLVQVYNNDIYGAYSLNLFSGYDIEQVEDLVKKNKNATTEVSKLVQDYMYQLYSTRTLDYNARQAAIPRYFYYDLRNIVEGTLKNRENMTFGEGPFKFYENHNLIMSGTYGKDDKKEGKWMRFYASGGIMEEKFFKQGIETGEHKEYAMSGALRKVTVYGANGEQIEERSYSKQGILEEVRKKKENGNIEYTSYYPNGHKEVVLVVQKGKITDGKNIYYYDNGAVKREFVSKNGKMNGSAREYFENGKLYTEGTMEDNEKEGTFTNYFENGKRDNKYNYRKGVMEGPYEEYLDNGTLLISGAYSNGKLDGHQKYFSRNGIEYGNVVFARGIPVSVKYTKTDKTSVYSREDQKGLLQYENYYFNGNKKSVISLNKNGDAEGMQTYYYQTGGLWQKANYKAGLQQGESISYHKNGQKYEEDTYKENIRDGYHKAYYPSGIVQAEGWLRNDKKQGLWKFYSVNGKIDNEIYYLDNELNGFLRGYNIAGELLYKEIYEDGMLTGVIKYDSAGKIRGTTYFPLTQCTYNLTTSDDRPYYSCEMNYGMQHGRVVKSYSNGKNRELGQYVFGKRDSIFTTYYPSGQISSIGAYRKDMKEGEWKYYNELGELKMQEYYINGREEGEARLFTNNELRYLYNYHKGEIDGKMTIYGDGGKVAGVLIYEDGLLVGYTYEDKDGRLLPATEVNNGSARISTKYANGEKALSLNIVENISEGSQQLYYSNGQLAEERNYKNQVLEGPYRKFYLSGKPQYETEYKADEINGAEKFFGENGDVTIHKNYYYGSLHGSSFITDPVTKKTTTATYRYGVMQ